ncbi:hypothetical protein EVAR_9931_1 [Eumeta japonica]|uniref:Uncharacterized protein n=1 Tax=Eumeta variegata TaxID=151549 RepID=A0A4C1TQV4_EUMVA|nr:hypothetical protein EVAR_9931_1 [Eumeta japonica]
MLLQNSHCCYYVLHPCGHYALFVCGIRQPRQRSQLLHLSQHDSVWAAEPHLQPFKVLIRAHLCDEQALYSFPGSSPQASTYAYQIPLEPK